MSDIAAEACEQCGTKFRTSPELAALLQRLRIGGTSEAQCLPLPKSCSACRRQDRLAFLNQRALYRRTCSQTGKPIISIYSPDKCFTVFSPDAWWADSWEGTQFGRDFDFSRSFFEQFAEVMQVVPWPALSTVGCENCDYNNFLSNSRNCYLCFDGVDHQDCYYCSGSLKVKDSMEVFWSGEIELSYDIFSGANLYHCFYCDNCARSQDLYFCKNCSNCSDCIGCVNLRHKKYHIFNQPQSKVDYEAYLRQMKLGSWQFIQEFRFKAEEFFLGSPRAPAILESAENCSGDMIYNSKNVRASFSVSAARDSMYLTDCARVQDASDMCSTYDCTGLTYQCNNSSILFNTAFVTDCRSCSDSFYLMQCYNCRDCFGSVGLRKKQYCLLNKQYTEREYKTLMPKVIAHLQETGEWGEFFPPGLSPFGYNETLAQYYFPLTAARARERGSWWSTYDAPTVNSGRVVDASELPDRIDDASDSLALSAIRCLETQRLFRITSAEIAQLKRLQVPLPRTHADQRFANFLGRINPRWVWKRQCDCSRGLHGHSDRCPNSFHSTYAPERREQVFCRSCFEKELI